MFKYGSIRLFLIKIFFGLILMSLSIIHLISIFTYSIYDPGFNTFSNNNSGEVYNFFGLLGSYLSSYSIVILGQLSFLIGIFILIEGIALFFGYQKKQILIRFFSNIIGIILIQTFSSSLSINFIENGIVSIFFSKLILNIFYSFTDNLIFFYISNCFLLFFGVFFILFSYSIKIKYLKKPFFVIKFFKYFRYLFLILKIFNLFSRKKSFNKFNKKSEPTINKRNGLYNEPKLQKSSSEYKQMEIDQFRFNLPSVKLLLKPISKNNVFKELDKNNKEASLKLEKTLSEYGVEGKVIGYKTGPIVTLFEFIPNAGIKSSKVIGLSDDIARAMSSISARISSQPGKTSLGIEIPNQKREDVLFGELVDDDRFGGYGGGLRLALGKNISGEKVFADLEKMPHLLIAGTTGSGKSVGINTMILSLLFRFKPNECKLILIDPKMLELSVYEDIPHLLTPVVTDSKKAVFALKWVVREMENRYKLMSSLNVKNIESYNVKVNKTISAGRKLYREVQTGIDNDTRMPILEKKEIALEKMPFIVVVIDEMADLMMVAGKEVESLVQRLAQMARASGIHLITATQRPSVDVITGTIKANFPSRISYKVASKFDSRTILNEMGAEQLLGSGDMLFLENGGNIVRLHGGFVSEAEVEKVVSKIKSQATFDQKKEISLQDKNISNGINDDLISDNNDELYNKAVEIVVKQQKVSTSYIQRYLQIGYNRAARIVEKMEEDGIISEANNAGKRHVLKKN